MYTKIIAYIYIYSTNENSYGDMVEIKFDPHHQIGVNDRQLISQAGNGLKTTLFEVETK